MRRFGAPDCRSCCFSRLLSCEIEYFVELARLLARQPSRRARLACCSALLLLLRIYSEARSWLFAIVVRWFVEVGRQKSRRPWFDNFRSTSRHGPNIVRCPVVRGPSLLRFMISSYSVPHYPEIVSGSTLVPVLHIWQGNALIID